MTVRLTHIGGPTLLVEAHGWRVLSDPTFDPPGRRYSFGWGTSSTKITGPAIEAADLPPLDAVLLSHDHHADNLDDAGRALLPSVPTVVTTQSGTRGSPRPTFGASRPGRQRRRSASRGCPTSPSPPPRVGTVHR